MLPVVYPDDSWVADAGVGTPVSSNTDMIAALL